MSEPRAVAAEQDPTAEPIAIIGMATRVPGAMDVKSFWDNLIHGVESVRFTTEDEQRQLGVSEDDLLNPDFVPAALVLDHMDELDEQLFGMTAREAALADPQQRVLLELAHTALDNAAIDPHRYQGDIGVYVGAGPSTYAWTHLMANPDVVSSAGMLGVSVGNSADYLATNISYKLDLRGPSLSVATACSTSLVACHLACEALRNYECDAALAGGSCVELPHGAGYLAAEGYTSPDGHVRPFDADAKGTMWGSGVGIVVLKRLSDALAEGDNVRALIIGNAINNDGSDKVGFSAPSVSGQAETIRAALSVAGIPARSIGFVEAHGTGTSLGDPIEVAALRQVYGSESGQASAWCALGSVKSNIGHLSQAAGVVGLIKAALAVETGLVPPSLNFAVPNPAIDFEHSPFYVPTTVTTLEAANGQPRRAAVSSFGIGGTNGHLIVEQAPPVADDASHIKASVHAVKLTSGWMPWT